MANDGDRRHLTSRQIQELLDRQLTPGEEGLAREHLAVCPHCRAEVEGWQMLFSDLGQLPELEPGPAFSPSVMEEVPGGKPVRHRVREWVDHRTREGEEAHVPVGSIQDYLEGILPAQPAARVEAHLESCTSCSQRVQEWEDLISAFEPLERFAPGPGFADEVMARVMVPTPMPVQAGWSSLPGRTLAWVRSLLPKSRHAWAVAGGVASAPTITLAALIYMVFSRPLLTPGTLGAYLLWKGSDLVPWVINTFSVAACRTRSTIRRRSAASISRLSFFISDSMR